MGSKWFTGGVAAAPRGRIQFDFMFEGVRYRPSIRRPPSEANLRRARERLDEIKRQIAVGTFSFAEEFPDYRFLRRVNCSAKVRCCNQVFDEFLAHCESRLAKQDMAAATLMSYRRVLSGIWRPALGTQLFHQVRYSMLVRIADSRAWSKKTYNNAISVVRCAFDFGWRDHPEHPNPARGLRSARLKKKDRPKIDPFCMQDAETLIAALHRDWGEAQGNYDEFRFFTGLRPSEEIALVLSDLDLVNGIISVNKARVDGIDRCQTKTGEDRRIVLCPRAVAVLKRQLALRVRLESVGAINHDHVFFQESGEPFRNLQYPGIRWHKTLNALKLRYRRPYIARHSSVSWNLMIGKNPLWVAKQHGHSIATMLRVYAAWAEGAVESDVEAIKRSLRGRPAQLEPDSRRYQEIDPSAASIHCRPALRGPCSSKISAATENLAVDLPVRTGTANQVTERKGKLLAEREGFERSSSDISKLPKNHAIPSPPIPSNPRIWHWIWHWIGFERAGRRSVEFTLNHAWFEQNGYENGYTPDVGSRAQSCRTSTLPIAVIPPSSSGMPESNYAFGFENRGASELSVTAFAIQCLSM